jgi:hypothetical protein
MTYETGLLLIMLGMKNILGTNSRDNRVIHFRSYCVGEGLFHVQLAMICCATFLVQLNVICCRTCCLALDVLDVRIFPDKTGRVTR